MLLAINANNTNTVFAVWDGDALRGAWRAATDARAPPTSMSSGSTQLLALEGLTRGDIDGAIIASVVPEAISTCCTLCRRYCNSEPLVVGDAGRRARHRGAGRPAGGGRRRPAGQHRRGA